MSWCFNTMFHTDSRLVEPGPSVRLWSLWHHEYGIIQSRDVIGHEPLNRLVYEIKVADKQTHGHVDWCAILWYLWFLADFYSKYNIVHIQCVDNVLSSTFVSILWGKEFHDRTTKVHTCLPGTDRQNEIIGVTSRWTTSALLCVSSMKIIVCRQRISCLQDLEDEQQQKHVLLLFVIDKETNYCAFDMPY